MGLSLLFLLRFLWLANFARGLLFLRERIASQVAANRATPPISVRIRGSGIFEFWGEFPVEFEPGVVADVGVEVVGAKEPKFGTGAEVSVFWGLEIAFVCTS